MNHWLIEITGHKFDLEQLKNLNFIPGTTLIDEDGKYFLKSDEFDSFTESQDVLLRGKSILTTINGIGKLMNNGWQSMTCAGVIREEPDGKQTKFVFLEDTITGRSSVTCTLTVTKGGSTINEPRTPSFIESAYIIVGKDAAVEKAMRIYGTREHNWVNLYIIYEVIESDAGGKTALVNNGWASEAKIKKFKHTANSVGALGDNARHGSENTSPPTNPMPLEEAQSLIETLLKKWIAAK